MRTKVNVVWKKYWKRGLSLVLVFALLAGYITWSSFDNVSASETVLEMPYFQRFHILPAQLAEKTELYSAYDNAEYCSYSCSDKNIITSLKSGGYTLPYRTFRGYGSVINTVESKAIVKMGTYYLTIKLGPYTGYNPFYGYSQMSQLSTRVVYQNTKHWSMWKAENYDVQEEGTLKTDWNNMKLKGNCVYEISDIMVIVADFDMPDVTNFTAETLDGVPILWLDCGEMIRPSNSNITESMLAQMRVSVELYPKTQQNAENAVTAVFQATELDYSKGLIGFTPMTESELTESKKAEIYGSASAVPSNLTSQDQLMGKEWRVVSIKDVSKETTYALQTSVGNTEYTVSSPITDMAGNPVELAAEIKYDGTQKVYLDAVAPTVVKAEQTGSMIKSDQKDEDIARADMFAGIGEYVSMSLQLSEIVSLDEGASMDDIYLEWNVTDKNGNYITTKLTEMVIDSGSANTEPVTVLKFEPVVVEEGMQGLITPKRLVGFANLVDNSDNHMASGTFEGIALGKDIGIDAAGPTVEVLESIPVTDEKNEKYYIYKIQISDGDDRSPVAGAGIITADNKTIPQYFSISSDMNTDNLRWQYAITNSVETVEFTGTGVPLSVEKSYAPFTLYENNQIFFLHVYLQAGDDYELTNEAEIYLDFKLEDAKANVSEVRAEVLTDLKIDNKAPTLTVNPQAAVITKESTTENKVVFSAIIDKVTDLNTIKTLEYQWTETGTDLAENNWTIIDASQIANKPKVECEVTVDFSSGETVASEVKRTLYVRATDELGNVTLYQSNESDFVANVERLNPQYEVVYDSTKVSGIGDVLISAPMSTDGSLGGYTRILLTRYVGTEYEQTLIRVIYFDPSDPDIATKTYSLFDDDAEWYAVWIENGKYEAVNDPDSDELDWNTYYGEVTFRIAACDTADDVIPVAGNAVTPSNVTFQESGTYEMVHTCSKSNVHKITFNSIMNASGETVSYSSYAGSYRIMQELAGVRFNFTIGNTILSSLGSSDVDFEQSYAVVMLADANGNVTSTAVSNKLYLAAGSEQSIAVPYKAGGYDSGVYALKVHIVTKNGASQDITLSQLLLLDNEKLPERFGVTSYTKTVSLGYDVYSSVQTLDWGKTAADGEILTTVSVGVAEKNLTTEVVYVDGKPAFTKLSTNGLDSAGRMQLTIQADFTGSEMMGVTLGKVTGIRIWNQASTGDVSSVDWYTEGAYDGIVSSCSYDALNNYIVKLNVGLVDSSNDILVDAETLAATDVDDFRLTTGRNVICYQLQMENGKVSPIYTFDWNLYEEMPMVDLSYVTEGELVRTDYVYSEADVYRIKDSAYDRTYAWNYYINIDNAYSPNGELSVYRVTYGDGAEPWVCEKVDATQPIPILQESINGYDGLWGTGSTLSSGEYTPRTIQEFYLVIDEMGNAIRYFPIITDNLSTVKSVENSGWSVLEEDENGRSWAIAEEGAEPTMYYFTTDKSVGSLEVEVFEPDYEYGDGVSSMLSFDTVPYETLEQVSITIDDGVEVMLDTLEVHTPGFNQAGIVQFEGHDLYGYILHYVFPYDSTKADGELIEHTVVVKGYIDGELAVDIDGNEVVKTLTVTAENVKPAITQSGTPELGAANVKANTYLYAAGITENEDGDFGLEFALPVYMDGKYTQGFYDKYGIYYELEVEITDMPTDPQVTLSTTEATTEDVVVTVTSESGTLTISSDYELPEGAVVTGEGTAELTVTMPENGYFEVICTYEDGTTKTACVSVSNIHNQPIEPVLVWNYNIYKVDPTDNSYEGEITVVLADQNGSLLIDLATGNTPTYTFVPGGETSYTFDNYVNEYGVAGTTVVATLPVTLKGTTAESDTYAPDVAITGYAKFENSVEDFTGAFVRTDATRPGAGTDEAVVSVPNYAVVYGEEYIFDSMDQLMAQAVFAERFIFRLDIGDENQVKLFLVADKDAQIPDYATGISDTIEGVSLIGRTLSISQNTEFTLYIVDSNNNATSIYFDVDNLEDVPPAPVATQVLTKDGNEVRVYLTNPNLEGVSELTIKNDKALTETDTNSSFYGMQYLSFTENQPDGVTIFYSYKYNGQTFTGSMVIYVNGLDTTIPQVTQTKWSGNYDGTGVRYTNQDITLQLEISKALSDAYLCDADGNLILPPTGVTVAYVEDRVTLIFEENTETLYLKITDSVNKKLTNIIAIPAVTTIDKTPATLSVNTEYSENHRKATVTVTSNEMVTWPNGMIGTKYTVTVKQNGTFEVSATDKGGNVSKTSVTFADILEEDLEIVISTDGDEATIIDPQIHQVNIGDTIYVKTNRTAVVSLNADLTGVSVAAENWTAFVITEDSEGLYPSIKAVDAYGNTAYVQFLQIPMKDRTAPSIMLNKNLISASLDATAEELEAILRSNFTASDNETAKDQLKFYYSIPSATMAGTYEVIYYVEDEAGNVGQAKGQIRLYGGEEILIQVNGERVERDATILVSAGTQTITITHNGEPYKVDWRSGIRTVAQMKKNSNVLSGYTEELNNEMTLELAEAGYYTILVTTQGRDTYRFVLYVEE